LKAAETKMAAYAIIPGKMLQIGDQFDRYQITSYLAQGGMSDIYRAYDLVARRAVVIKVPDQAMLGDPAQYERFQREMEVLGTLEHPSILKGLGSGKYNRIPYLATEFVEGRSLREMLEAGPLPAETVIPLVLKIASGLAYCHANGVIHRDLKPENILVTEAGQPVIMDFGLALTKSAHRVTYSNLSATMGTPDYMAPEQIEGQRGDARTDLYALGTIFFELLAGRPPFTGDNQMAVLNQHLNATAPRLDRLNPGISPHLAAIAAKCLARQPEQRYPDMPALIEALQHPEQADLSVLEQTPALKNDSELAHTLKYVGIAFAILAVVTGLALVLQSLR